MKRMLERILREYGNDIETADGSVSLRGFIQPVTARSQQNLHRSVSQLGEISTGKYIYIGPAGFLPAQDQVLICGGTKYVVCRAEMLTVSGEDLYVWGLLRLHGGDDLWNN